MLAFINQQGRYVYVSPSLCKQSGYTKTEFLALYVTNLDIGTDLMRFQALIEVLQRQTVPPFESVFRRKDGSNFPVEISASLIEFEGDIYVCGIARDITERKRSEEMLSRSSNQLKIFINHAPISMAMFDLNMNYLAASGRWFADHSRSYFDLIGHNHYQVFPDLPDKWKTIHRLGLAGETLKNDEDIWLQADGNKRWLRWAVVPWRDEHDLVGGIIISSEDITDRKLGETELAKRTKQLEATNAELQAFSYSVSHDLRGPLHVISWFTQMLLSEQGPVIPEAAKPYLNRIIFAAKRMENLITDMLEFSQVSSGNLEPRTIDLSRMAESILLELQQMEPDRKAAIKITPEVYFEGDPHLMNIVLDNLLSNAWKFTRQRNITEIEFGIYQDAESKIYFIRDNGAGFDPQFAQKLFGPFQRFHDQKDFPGTGIGLATVKRIISRHGGEVWAESQPDVGTTFFFKT